MYSTAILSYRYDRIMLDGNTDKIQNRPDEN